MPQEDRLAMMVRLAETGQVDTLVKLFGENSLTMRSKALTSTLLYGQGGLFSICASDNLVNASVNDDGLAAAISWIPTVSDVRRQPAITAIGHLEGGDQPDDQCGDPPLSGWKGCEIEWCLGRIKGRSPEFDRTDLGTRWCEAYPIFRTFGSVTVGGDVIVPQGSLIQNDAEWGSVAAAIQVRQILGRWLYTGNRTSSPNMFDGMQVLVNTGYIDLKAKVACPALDSTVVDFAGNCVNDPAVTISIYRYIDHIVQRIIQRARQAGLGRPLPKDMRIVLRTEMAEALYEQWAWNMGAMSTGFQPGNSQTQFVNADWSRSTADDLRARQVLRIQGMDIPIITDDYMPFTGAAGEKRISDIYVMTLQISGLPIVYGEYQDFRAGVGDGITGFYEELYGGRATDLGKFYVWQERTNTCFDIRLSLKPRLVIALPFLQGRITNVCVETLEAPLSSYPPDGSPYYPDGGSSSAWYDAGNCVYTE